jgi:hypothetical protein
MTIPAILFGVVLSSAYGTAFHFWKGGGMNKLFYYVILAWLGFWIGHFVGGLIGWSFAAIGPLNAGMATLGSLVVLVAGEWLGCIEVTTK